MRKSFVVGTFAFVFAAGGVSACGSNGSGSKVDTRVSVARPAADLVQKATATPEAMPVAIRETAGGTGTRPEDLDKASKGVRATLVLAEGKSGFRVNSMSLSEDAKAKIDELFADGKTDLTGAHFEIEGHTDNLGSKELNDKVGLARAQAVKQYLCERYEISPAAVKVISYGLDKPVADNATPEGRAMNRRVVIKVLD
jgi:peptidoglycan-associated lipoprotein